MNSQNRKFYRTNQSFIKTPMSMNNNYSRRINPTSHRSNMTPISIRNRLFSQSKTTPPTPSFFKSKDGVQWKYLYEEVINEEEIQRVPSLAERFAEEPTEGICGDFYIKEETCFEEMDPLFVEDIVNEIVRVNGIYQWYRTLSRSSYTRRIFRKYRRRVVYGQINEQITTSNLKRSSTECLVSDEEGILSHGNGRIKKRIISPMTRNIGRYYSTDTNNSKTAIENITYSSEAPKVNEQIEIKPSSAKYITEIRLPSRIETQKQQKNSSFQRRLQNSVNMENMEPVMRSTSINVNTTQRDLTSHQNAADGYDQVRLREKSSICDDLHLANELSRKRHSASDDEGFLWPHKLKIENNRPITIHDNSNQNESTLCSAEAITFQSSLDEPNSQGFVSDQSFDLLGSHGSIKNNKIQQNREDSDTMYATVHKTNKFHTIITEDDGSNAKMTSVYHANYTHAIDQNLDNKNKIVSTHHSEYGHAIEEGRRDIECPDSSLKNVVEWHLRILPDSKEQVMPDQEIFASPNSLLINKEDIHCIKSTKSSSPNLNICETGAATGNHLNDIVEWHLQSPTDVISRSTSPSQINTENIDDPLVQYTTDKLKNEYNDAPKETIEYVQPEPQIDSVKQITIADDIRNSFPSIDSIIDQDASELKENISEVSEDNLPISSAHNVLPSSLSTSKLDDKAIDEQLNSNIAEIINWHCTVQHMPRLTDNPDYFVADSKVESCPPISILHKQPSSIHEIIRWHIQDIRENLSPTALSHVKATEELATGSSHDVSERSLEAIHISTETEGNVHKLIDNVEPTIQSREIHSISEIIKDIESGTTLSTDSNTLIISDGEEQLPTTDYFPKFNDVDINFNDQIASSIKSVDVPSINESTKNSIASVDTTTTTLNDATANVSQNEDATPPLNKVGEIKIDVKETVNTSDSFAPVLKPRSTLDMAIRTENVFSNIHAVEKLLPCGGRTSTSELKLQMPSFEWSSVESDPYFDAEERVVSETEPKDSLKTIANLKENETINLQAATSTEIASELKSTLKCTNEGNDMNILRKQLSQEPQFQLSASHYCSLERPAIYGKYLEISSTGKATVVIGKSLNDKDGSVNSLAEIIKVHIKGNKSLSSDVNMEPRQDIEKNKVSVVDKRNAQFTLQIHDSKDEKPSYDESECKLETVKYTRSPFQTVTSHYCSLVRPSIYELCLEFLSKRNKNLSIDRSRSSGEDITIAVNENVDKENSEDITSSFDEITKNPDSSVATNQIEVCSWPVQLLSNSSVENANETLEFRKCQEVSEDVAMEVMVDESVLLNIEGSMILNDLEAIGSTEINEMQPEISNVEQSRYQPADVIVESHDCVVDKIELDGNESLKPTQLTTIDSKKYVSTNESVVQSPAQSTMVSQRSKELNTFAEKNRRSSKEEAKVLKRLNDSASTLIASSASAITDNVNHIDADIVVASMPRKNGMNNEIKNLRICEIMSQHIALFYPRKDSIELASFKCLPKQRNSGLIKIMSEIKQLIESSVVTVPESVHQGNQSELVVGGEPFDTTLFLNKSICEYTLNEEHEPMSNDQTSNVNLYFDLQSERLNHLDQIVSKQIPEANRNSSKSDFDESSFTRKSVTDYFKDSRECDSIMNDPQDTRQFEILPLYTHRMSGELISIPTHSRAIQDYDDLEIEIPSVYDDIFATQTNNMRLGLVQVESVCKTDDIQSPPQTYVSLAGEKTLHKASKAYDRINKDTAKLANVVSMEHGKSDASIASNLYSTMDESMPTKHDNKRKHLDMSKLAYKENQKMLSEANAIFLKESCSDEIASPISTRTESHCSNGETVSTSVPQKPKGKSKLPVSTEKCIKRNAKSSLSEQPIYDNNEFAIIENNDPIESLIVRSELLTNNLERDRNLVREVRDNLTRQFADLLVTNAETRITDSISVSDDNRQTKNPVKSVDVVVDAHKAVPKRMKEPDTSLAASNRSEQMKKSLEILRNNQPGFVREHKHWNENEYSHYSNVNSSQIKQSHAKIPSDHLPPLKCDDSHADFDPVFDTLVCKLQTGEPPTRSSQISSSTITESSNSSSNESLPLSIRRRR